MGRPGKALRIKTANRPRREESVRVYRGRGRRGEGTKLTRGHVITRVRMCSSRPGTLSSGPVSESARERLGTVARPRSLSAVRSVPSGVWPLSRALSPAWALRASTDTQTRTSATVYRVDFKFQSRTRSRPQIPCSHPMPPCIKTQPPLVRGCARSRTQPGVKCKPSLSLPRTGHRVRDSTTPRVEPGALRPPTGPHAPWVRPTRRSSTAVGGPVAAGTAE